jgi:predicted RNase H-like HicB family nuclease
MKQAQRLTAIIEREDDGFLALCPELDIASEGASIEEARTNLIEALTLFFETAAPSEVARRFQREVLVTDITAAAPSLMEQEQAAAAKRRFLARIRSAPDRGTGGGADWSREELHEC